MVHRLDKLRARLVDGMRSVGSLTDPAVETAFLAVPRHEFVPEAPPDEAYQDRVILTKQTSEGKPLSSASQPSIVALMLEQLDVRKGHRVLEIGAGTGYNAALLAELVGASGATPRGAVTTVDIDPETVARAKHALTTTGYRDVRVIEGDGGLGMPEFAPYDRIIVTVGAWDLPPAWRTQLAPNGILVVPLSIKGVDVSVVFEAETEADGEILRGRDPVGCGFMPMRGGFGWRGQRVEFGPGGPTGSGGGISITVDDGRPLDPATLSNALTMPSRTIQTGVVATRSQVWTSLDLWLVTADPAFCRVEVAVNAADVGGLPGTLGFATGDGRNAGIADRDGFAVVTYESDGTRHSEHATEFRLGVSGFGRTGEALANRLAGHIRTWQEQGRPDLDRLEIIAVPAGSGDVGLRDHTVVEKHHTRIAIRWT